jgi:hypothetical protein
MGRPRVELANFDHVYRYYERHRQNRVFALIMHVLFARVYRCDVSYEPGAEDAIREALAAENRLILSPNHTTADDQYVIVSVVQKLHALRPLRGTTFIPSEPSLFTRRGVAGRMLRRGVDGLGAVPTFRLEDLRRAGVERTPEIEDQHRRSMERASDAQVAKLLHGECMAGFWEGTRNRTDYRVVQPLKKGIAHTVIEAAEQVPVLLVPMGFYYGGEPADYRHPDLPGRHRPLVRVGVPIPVTTSSTDELIALLHPAMQLCVDHVVARTAAALHPVPEVSRGA